jgi:hypothetical protein
MNQPKDQSCLWNFDFNDWKRLALSDPEEFEKRRQQVIEEFMSRCGAHPRLRCVQWRIDMERRKYHHPLVSCVHLYSLMWNYVHADNGFLDALLQMSDSSCATPPRRHPVKSAKIFQFPALKN